VGKSRASIAALMEIRPDSANVERDGEVVTVDPAEVAVDEVILVRPGERIPLDGEIIEGMTTLDTAALTGESLPREVVAGDAIISGCVNLTGLIRVRVTKLFGESTVAKILELVENAGEQKSRSEQFITRFARYYTPAVVIAAALLAVIPPLLIGMTDLAVWQDWLLRAMSFLVISCPCALVISVPLSFFGGIGGASRCGILVKGSCYLEALAGCDTVVFDKTGTLTEGRFSVVSITSAEGYSSEEVLRLAACTEQYSSHPIAHALVDACNPRPTEADVHPASVEELAGHGVRAEVTDGAGHTRRVAVGNGKLMDSEGAAWVPTKGMGTAVYVSVDGVFAGSILVADTLKPDSAEAIAALRRSGVKRTVILTGDGEETAAAVAAELRLDEYHAALLPADKVERAEALLSDPARRGKLAFVGDGINDAPVLARADVGIAMGGMGSDAAIEAADVVLMDDRVSGLPRAISIARRTLRIVKQNIVFALGVKAVILVLGALGYAGLWAAVFADVGVAVLAILNAMRALKVKD
ncbi:MAG: heavy metal translocating P-type ATPase, partial [Clostridia bacterium]|nr:heavy metal translocating P-type ATPase [Clostridia bacterium]